MPAHKIPISERLAAGWHLDPQTGCHVWQRSRTRNGYGVISEHSKNRMAHRVAFELARGPIPDGLEIDHLCRNASCVNPAHLEAVTPGENVRRAGPATKRSCVNGHPFTIENTRMIGFQRVCRTCGRERAALHDWKKAAARQALLAELEMEREMRRRAEDRVRELESILEAFGAERGVTFKERSEAA